MAGNIARAGTFDAIMVAGGDGTLSDVADGIALAAVDRPPALAILPLGTANVMAVEIGLPMAPAAAASVVAAMRTITMPLARVGARHFLLMAGAGFDAHVVSGVSAIAKRRWGKFAYVLEMIRQLHCFPFDRYRVNVDGTEYDAASVVVSRGRFYGGRFLLAPAARLSDARLHVCLFGKGGRVGALLYAVALGLGLLPRSPGFRIVEATRVTIEGVEGVEGEPVQGDGDSLARLPVEIEMTAMSLPLVVP
jgi:diacylglycerol kinase family enzyme